jgi:hypothetical protein
MPKTDREPVRAVTPPIDMPDAILLKERKLRLLPHKNESVADRVLPKRTNERTDKLEPPWQWSAMLNRACNLETPPTLQEEPARTKERTEMLEPALRKSKTEQLAPNRLKERNDKLEPSTVRSHTLICHRLPRWAIPATERLEPRRTKFLKLKPLPLHIVSRIDNLLPIFAKLRTDKLEPRFT